jgi:DNA-binding beta-propeller fold protein YncE
LPHFSGLKLHEPSEQNNVSVFAIDSGIGALTEVGSPVAAGSKPSSVTVEPSGQFAYVANSDSIFVFIINSSTGALTAMGSPVPTHCLSSVVTTRKIQ